MATAFWAASICFVLMSAWNLTRAACSAVVRSAEESMRSPGDGQGCSTQLVPGPVGEPAVDGNLVDGRDVGLGLLLDEGPWVAAEDWIRDPPGRSRRSVGCPDSGSPVRTRSRCRSRCSRSAEGADRRRGWAWARRSQPARRGEGHWPSRSANGGNDGTLPHPPLVLTTFRSCHGQGHLRPRSPGRSRGRPGHGDRPGDEPSTRFDDASLVVTQRDDDQALAGADDFAAARTRR